MARKLIPEFQDPKFTEAEEAFEKENKRVALEGGPADLRREIMQSRRPGLIVPENKTWQAMKWVLDEMRLRTPAIYDSLRKFVLEGTPIPEGHRSSLYIKEVIFQDDQDRYYADSRAEEYVRSFEKTRKKV